jgi:hypothetical protein
MHAAAVELLVDKANLEPSVALAFGEAIDMALKEAQFVTVPILDARFAVADAKIEARFAAVDARFATLEAKIDARFAAADARMDQIKAELLVRMEQIKADLVRWLFLLVVGNAAVSAALNVILLVH